jgi:hypothetical protein
MNNLKLLQAVADISYIAGTEKHYSGNSRFDISEYIRWPKEFERIHKNTDWSDEDYMLAIEKYADDRIKQAMKEGTVFE